MKPIVDIRDYAYRYPCRENWALSKLSLRVRPGECVCFTGPSGCGKTTLLLAIAGLLKSGREKGSIELSNGNGHGRAGLVFQNAESQLLCTTVADEVAFGPQNLGFDQKEIETAVKRSLEMVALTGLKDRNVEALSAGQTHRLAIASVISTAPGTLLLDEPTAQLDAQGKLALKALLEKMKQAGRTLLIADHELGPFTSIADRYVFMDHGSIERIDGHFPSGFTLSSPERGHQHPTDKEDWIQPLLSVEGVRLSDANGHPLFDPVDLRLWPARRTFVHGPNGSGKTSLLKCMAGLIRPEAGRVHMAGMGRPAPNRLLGEMGLLFQNPESQMFEDTVEDEVAYSLRRMKTSRRLIKSRVREMLDIFDIGHLKGHSPLTLSFGEQHRVTLASVMAPQPKILMLDEPFSGLEFGQRKRILKMLSRLCKAQGTTIVIASHEFLPDPTWADDIFELTRGHIDALSTQS